MTDSHQKLTIVVQSYKLEQKSKLWNATHSHLLYSTSINFFPYRQLVPLLLLKALLTKNRDYLEEWYKVDKECNLDDIDN